MTLDIPKLAGGDRLLWLSGLANRERVMLETRMRTAVGSLLRDMTTAELRMPLVDLYEKGMRDVGALSVDTTAESIREALSAAWSALEALHLITDYRWDWGYWPAEGNDPAGEGWMRAMMEPDPVAELTKRHMSDEEVVAAIERGTGSGGQIGEIPFLVPDPDGTFPFGNVAMHQAIAEGRPWTGED